MMFYDSTAIDPKHAAYCEGLRKAASRPKVAEVVELARAKVECDTSDRRSKFVRASQVTQTNVPWLWPGRLVLDGPNLIAGAPDVGKSMFIASIAACVSAGKAWPDGKPNPEPGDVLIRETEDAYNHTVVPRLAAAGADLDRIFLAKPTDPILPSDLHGFKMFWPSPAISLMDIQFDSNREQDVRAWMAEWAEGCRTHNCALIAPAHLNKKEDLGAINRIMGSGAMSAFPRSVWTIVRDNEDKSERLFLRIKANLAGDDTDGLRFRIEHIGPLEQSVCCTWLGRSEKAADQVMAANRNPGGPSASTWLRDFLAAHGETRVSDVKKAAADAGFTEEALRKAKQRNPQILEDHVGKSYYWRLNRRTKEST